MRYTTHGWPMPGTPKTDNSHLKIVPECTGPYDCQQCLAEMKQDFAANNSDYKEFWREAMTQVNMTLRTDTDGPGSYDALVGCVEDILLGSFEIAPDKDSPNRTFEPEAQNIVNSLLKRLDIEVQR